MPEYTIHVVEHAVELANDGILHRFINTSGTDRKNNSISSIYVNGVQRATCPSESETEMINWWNREGCYHS